MILPNCAVDFSNQCKDASGQNNFDFQLGLSAKDREDFADLSNFVSLR